MNKNVFNSLSLLIAFLSACSPIININPTATTIPTGTPLYIDSPVRPELNNAEGPTYTLQQIQSIESGIFNNQEELLATWWNYWEKAGNRPFQLDTNAIYTYYWDKNGKAGGVLIRPGGTYGSKNFYVPVIKNGYMSTPPEVEEGFTIPEGYGPFEISGGDKYVLGWEVNSSGQEGWVRLDENGEIAEIINFETGQWQPERFYTLTPEFKKGCEYNLIRPDHIEEDMEKLLEKERALGLTAEDAFVVVNYKDFIQSPSGLIYNRYHIGGWGTEYNDWAKNSEEVWKNRKITCSYMPTSDGKGIYILGIPIRRVDAGYPSYKKTDTWGWFHFGTDPDVQNIDGWKNQGNYFEDWEFYNITQNPDKDSGVIYVPMFCRYIKKDGTVEVDDYSRTSWDTKYSSIIDLLKISTLGSIYDLGDYQEKLQDPESFLREFVLADHRRTDNYDDKYIISNLEKAQTLIFPTLGISMGNR